MQIELPWTLYKCIVVDPPWPERGSGKCKRGADRHYPVMSPAMILETIRTSGVWRPDPAGCHLYMWATNTYLPDGLGLMRELEFRYVTNLCWSKAGKIGLGRYFRGRHELCLFGVIGSLMTQARDIPTEFLAKRGRHSQKPKEFFDLVERASPGPRLELFATEERPGWEAWGNKVWRR
jgi:N6-adenosine-specific RNA methylase IME4